MAEGHSILGDSASSTPLFPSYSPLAALDDTARASAIYRLLRFPFSHIPGGEIGDFPIGEHPAIRYPLITNALVKFVLHCGLDAVDEKGSDLYEALPNPSRWKWITQNLDPDWQPSKMEALLVSFLDHEGEWRGHKMEDCDEEALWDFAKHDALCLAGVIHLRLSTTRGPFVYFIEQIGGTPSVITIGKSNEPILRGKHHQRGSPLPLVLLTCIPESVVSEHEIHQRLAHLKMPGQREWFRKTLGLSLLIERYATESMEGMREANPEWLQKLLEVKAS